ncbi:NADH-quinone oxidoreductase subunit G [Sesbania bispinosa]|nr:NADH-quinone oxidoreductase subunit G [Sesbania bispinosa]
MATTKMRLWWCACRWRGEHRNNLLLTTVLGQRCVGGPTPATLGQWDGARSAWPREEASHFRRSIIGNCSFITVPFQLHHSRSLLSSPFATWRLLSPTAPVSFLHFMAGFM